MSFSSSRSTKRLRRKEKLLPPNLTASSPPNKMDFQQTSALNALAPFLALAPSAASPRAAADLILQATSAPHTYIFAELLEAPNVQNLRNAERQWSRWLRVLEIFCWGTWAEYQGMYPPPPTTATTSWLSQNFFPHFFPRASKATVL